MYKDIPQLTPKQLKACILIAEGVPFAKAAEQVGATKVSITAWRQEQLFNDYLSSILDDQQQLSILATYTDKLEAAESLICDLKHPKAETRFKSAVSLLDR